MAARIGVPAPSIEQGDDGYARLVIAPLSHDLALTIGTALRRTLLSVLPGAAITSVRIDGVTHEFSTIEHVLEDVPAILAGLQNMRFRMFAERPARLLLDVVGEHAVCAGDISQVADYEVVNPDLHIASLVDPAAVVTADIVVETGRGYREAAPYAEHLPIGTLAVDALFSPVRRVRMEIAEAAPDGGGGKQLILEVWTDRTIDGVAALRMAAGILDAMFAPLTALADLEEHVAPLFGVTGHENGALAATAMIGVEDLGLSARVVHALRRADLLSVGDVLARSERELLTLRNFGTGALAELRGALAAHGAMLA